ncbi:MAG: phospho-N-acetylmuramoyl-pentapeptide-transferase [Parasporobacterium sp.]|nr:phospho-N-acetylmuramoyl-pentapeptide-transferase [Parasporobacterium sp.]
MNNLVVILAFAISFILCVIMCPVMIPILRKLKFGQNVREEGPQSHLKKSGTPTMGGIAIVIAMIIGAVWFVGRDPGIWMILLMTLLFGAIGFIDDMLKIVHHQSEGLKAWQKMGLQIIVTAAMVLFVALGTENGTSLLVPFYGLVNFGGWFYPLAVFAILGTVNGANFTDGLDGLASTVTIVIAGFITVASAVLGRGISPAALSMAGALCAFLCYNCYPAKVFMGDTGSLALGGFVAASAFALKMPIFLIFIAFIYLAEILSVILQVGSFKMTHGKKRIFRMAPLHHHFELGGWSETRVVTIFTVVTLIGCILAYAGMGFVL